MTRINIIPVSELTDQHLLAEHREIKRIPNVIKSGKYSLKNQPKEFTLGTGHVKFFYDKLLFLFERYSELHLECINRGFKVERYFSSFDFKKLLGKGLMGNYNPTQKDIEISKQRIEEKIKAKPSFYKYYGKPLNNNF